MLRMDNFACKTCGNEFESLEKPSDLAVCACGSLDTERRPGVGEGKSVFTVTVATTKTSKRYKAGYGHEYHKPATKIQSGYGGKARG